MNIKMSSNEDEWKTPYDSGPHHTAWDLQHNLELQWQHHPLSAHQTLIPVQNNSRSTDQYPLGAQDRYTFIYMYNVNEKIYGPEYSPRSNSPMRYNVDMPIDAFLKENKDNERGPHYNANQDQMIPRQLFSYTSCTKGCTRRKEHPSMDRLYTPNFPQQISRRDQEYHH